MAVVTFSPQTDMIREVLRERFGQELAMQVRFVLCILWCGACGAQAQSISQAVNHQSTIITPQKKQIPVRGEDGSWTYLGDGSHKGKQGHMASAVEELQSRFPSADITRASTVLIDDDRQNIEVRG
jgi:hypothetical protein